MELEKLRDIEEEGGVANIKRSRMNYMELVDEINQDRKALEY